MNTPAFGKTLILFTGSFPYGTGEVFIENEFDFLLTAFQKIFIITTNLNDEQTHRVPDAVKVIRLPYKSSFKFKIRAILNCFNPIIRNELGFIRNNRKLPVSKQVAFTLLGSYAKGLETFALLETLIAAHKIDTGSLHLYSYWMNDMVTGIAMFKRKNKDVKAVSRAHGWDVYFERQTPAYLPLRNFIIGNLNACYCVSENGVKYLDKITGHKYSNTIQLSCLGTYNRAKTINLPNKEKLRLISCSNIIPLKRVHLIVQAIALIKGINIEWVHFGSGPLEQELRQLAHENLSSMPNVKFDFAGHKNNAEILDYYLNNKVDLFINVSETEGLPVSIMEANSFGIPAIGTNVGGVSEIIKNDDNGFLITANCTPEIIATTIEEFSSFLPDKKDKFRKRAFELWDQNFNAEKNYQTFVTSMLSL